MAPPQLLADRRDHGSIRLRPCPAAATAARKMVREICSGCGLPAGLVEDAALVTGVLVTRSARQAHTAIPTRSLDGGIRSVFTAASAALRNVAAPAGGTVCPSAPDRCAESGARGVDLIVPGVAHRGCRVVAFVIVNVPAADRSGDPHRIQRAPVCHRRHRAGHSGTAALPRPREQPAGALSVFSLGYAVILDGSHVGR
jgi:hypothetical protein